MKVTEEQLDCILPQIECAIVQGKKNFTVSFFGHNAYVNVIKMDVLFPRGITPCRYEFTFSVSYSDGSFDLFYRCFECRVESV